MTVPDVRRETAEVLHRTLQALVTEAPGSLGYDHNRRVQAWTDAKKLNALREQWIKSGWHQETAVKEQIEHWYRLLAAVYEPSAE
jgi:hypothetical protein